LGSGAEDLEALACHIAEQPFCHLASGGVFSAKDENCFFLVHGRL
jgi:hypothetical protein